MEYFWEMQNTANEIVRNEIGKFWHIVHGDPSETMSPCVAVVDIDVTMETEK